MKKSFTENKEVFAKQPSQSYNYKQIQSLVEARLIYTGAVTGTRYIWEKSGTILSVDERDVPDLMSQKITSNSCCGGQGGSNTLQLV